VTAALITVAVLVALALIQALLTVHDRRRFRPPGRVIHGLHVVKTEAGSPAVVFESGLANSSLSWSLIQPKIAALTTTCSYDRAGLGWSQSSRTHCRLENLTEEFHRLLDSAQIPRPFILVGHSFGGLMARFYADRFPGELAGVVLVDPATPEEWMNPDRQQRWRLRRAVFFTRAAGVLAFFGLVRFGLWLLMVRKKDSPGPISRFSRTLERIRFELRKIPTDVRPLIRAHWSRPGFYWVMAEYLQAVPGCAEAVADCSFPKQVPVTVLSGAHQPPKRLAEHEALATTHIIAQGSGHFIHLDEPELVVNSIAQLLRQTTLSQR